MSDVKKKLIDALDRYLRQDETAGDTDNGVYRQGQAAMSDALTSAPAEPDAYNRRLRAQLEQEWADLQRLKNAYTTTGTPPAATVEQCIVPLVQALQHSKGWMHDYADAIVRDAIDRRHLLEEAPAAAGAAQAVALPEGWKLVVKKTCYVLQEGNTIVATLAGPDAEVNASKIASALAATPAPEGALMSRIEKLAEDICAGSSPEESLMLVSNFMREIGLKAARAEGREMSDRPYAKQWVRVPVEPTVEMINAGQCGCMDNDVTACIYRLMLDASPAMPLMTEADLPPHPEHHWIWTEMEKRSLINCANKLLGNGGSK